MQVASHWMGGIISTTTPRRNRGAYFRVVGILEMVEK